MKNIYIILFALVGSLTSYSQTSTIQDTTQVTFESKTIDYGTLVKGTDGTRTFTFKNTGEHNLLIEKIFSSSYCTVLSYTKEPVAPGNTGAIVVKYDTHKLGPIVKTVTVKMNVKEGIVSLNLKGKIIE
jgi:hypothetical protein